MSDKKKKLDSLENQEINTDNVQGGRKQLYKEQLYKRESTEETIEINVEKNGLKP